jgi:uncharacterized membrane protein
MKAFLGFVKTTLVGGVLFLLPLLVTLFILKKAVGALGKILRPVAEGIPVEAVAGIHVREILAALLLVAIGFVAGLIAKTTFGKAIRQRLEQLILRKMPGYTLLKSAAAGATGDGAEVQVALARFDDNTVLGFIVEPPSNGIVTVFVPSAPTPAAGTVFYLPEDRVQKLDVKVTDASNVIMRLGVGSKELLAKVPNGR